MSDDRPLVRAEDSAGEWGEWDDVQRSSHVRSRRRAPGELLPPAPTPRDAGGAGAAFGTRPLARPALARFDRYDILGRLAVGGMAEVYLAREPFDGGDAWRHVALKVVRSDLLYEGAEGLDTLFLREGRVAMQLAHPNICHVYEFGKWKGHLFIAMEWVDGLSLYDLLRELSRRGERLPPPLALRVAASVAGALDYAHRARDAARRHLGIVHRDVTPHNIMLRYDGVVKLLDFGVAHVRPMEERTRSTVMKGKFGYASPEQCLNHTLDGRSDVFALGVCLYEALTGRPLYRADSEYATYKAIVEEPVPHVRDVDPTLPESLDALLCQALAKDPFGRFQTAGEMQLAIEQVLLEMGEVVHSPQLARWLEPRYADRMARGPQLYTGPDVARRLAPSVAHPTISSVPPPPRPMPVASRRGFRWRSVAWGVALAVVLGGVAAAVTVALREGPERGQPAAETTPRATSPGAPDTAPVRPQPKAPPAAGEAPAKPSPPAAVDEASASGAEAPSRPAERREPASRRPSRRRERSGRAAPHFLQDPGFGEPKKGETKSPQMVRELDF